MTEEELKPAPEAEDFVAEEIEPEPEEVEVPESSEDDPIPNPAPTLVAAPQNTAYQEEAVAKAAEYEAATTGPPQEIEREFTIAAHMDEQRQKTPGGIYGDDVAAQQAELNAAAAEGREPDFENLAPAPGQKIYTTEEAKKLFPNSEPVVSFTAPVVVGVPEDSEQFAPDDEDEVPELEE